MTQIYGAVTEFREEDDISSGPATFYLAPFSIVEVRRFPDHRPAGISFMQVIVTPDVPIRALNLAVGQRLAFGGDMPTDADVLALFPFSCGPYQGFSDLVTDRRAGDGAFFLSLSEAEAWSTFGETKRVHLMSPQ